MAAAKTKRTPLVTVIEQLRTDTNKSEFMHDVRDVKRNTMLVDINAELTSINNVITESLQSLVFTLKSIKSEIVGPIVEPATVPAPKQEVTPPTSPQLDEVKESPQLDEVKDETSKGSSWLEKIFTLQEDEIMRQKERDREADRKGRLEDGGDKGGGGGDGAGKGSKLGKMLKGLFSIFTGLFKGIGKFAVMLLKPLLWLAKLPLMLASVTALWVGLAAVVAFFAAVTVASMTMSQEDFDKLKMNIANGVAGAISKVVEGAMNVWNSFVPESWKIDEESKKAFTEGTFTAVSETIVAVIEFVEKLSKSFDKGFSSQIEGFSKSWESFKAVFDKIVKAFSGSGIADETGKAVTGGLMAAAETIGAAILKISSFFLDLASALGSEALGEEAKTDNAFINTAAKIIVSIIKFIKDIAVSFGKGFASKFDSIAESFGTLKTKVGLVFDKVGKMIKDIGDKGTGENRTTIMGVFTMLGSALGSIIEGVLGIFNFIADFILDPTVQLAKIQVGVEDAFQNMGRRIADFIDNMFNMESLMKMIQGVLGKDSKIFGVVEGFMGTVEEHAAGRRKEMTGDKERMERKNVILARSSKETEKQLKAELALGEERDDARVTSLQKSLLREQADIRRNEAGIARINDNIRASEEIIVQEKVDEKMGEAARKQERANEELRNQIRGIERRNARLTETGVDANVESSWTDETITAKGWEGMLAAVQKTMKGVTAEQLASGDVQLSGDAIAEILRGNESFARDSLTNIKDQSIMFKTGLALQKEMAGNQLKLEQKKAKLAETDSTLAKKREGFETTIRSQVSTLEEVLDTQGQSLDPKQYVKKKEEGGFIGMSPFATGTIGKTMGLESGGLFTLSQGEFVLDNQAAQIFLQAAMILKGQDLSGTSLMDLQRVSSATQQTGGGMVNIVNNSPQQVNQSQQMFMPAPVIQPHNSGIHNTLS
jgi:hypothetical protein